MTKSEEIDRAQRTLRTAERMQQLRLIVFALRTAAEIAGAFIAMHFIIKFW